MGLFIGVDVSKKLLDVAFGRDSNIKQFANDKDGFSLLIAELKSLDITIVAFESSGGYEKSLFCALVEHKIPTATLNPKQVRDFAKALGILAKTDRLDAKVISHFAEVTAPVADKIPTETEVTLEGLVRRRRQLIDMKIMEQNRLENVSIKIRKRIDKSISFLQTQIKEIEKELDTILEQNETWKVKEQELDKIIGVGKTSARSMLVDIPELGTLTSREVAALVGLAPYHNESGGKDGRRTTKRGRKHVKRYLYMCVLSAIQVEGPLKKFYDRLVGRGKKKIVAIVATMRKLIVMANATVKKLNPATT